ncbi:hypothetical protein Pint_07605 [Pistacia integerrima]|uniref:Uncharacterized protein n=1 Tax=Pistacia integerrima TaxID=434235 RepID=A0ACC0XYB6_9ROSI|nr:hypothetical protein Pint_07605 [Pistacia integerrima]
MVKVEWRIQLTIVGHSLGGGTAAFLILLHICRANWMSCAAACMTWELAKSGNDFITSVINGADLVPTFSAASVDVAC